MSFKGDKQGLGMTKRNKEHVEVKPLLMLWAALAHHVVVIARLPKVNTLVRRDAPDIANRLGEPHIPIRSCGDIGRAAVRCRRRYQGDGAARGDAPDRVHLGSKVLIGEPEVAVGPCCNTAQVEGIITWIRKGEQGDGAARGDAPDPG